MLVAGAALGQDGFRASYDATRSVTLKGVVIKIDWVNPHAYLYMNVQDANWAVEIGNPLDLEKDGWKRTSIHIGDAVTVEGYLSRDESKRAFAQSVVLARTGAKLFTASNRNAAPTAAEPAPRWPDGQVRLGPAPGKKGYWGAASASSLSEKTGPRVPMNNEGIL